MPKSKGRRYNREVKLAAVKRMLAGENVPRLAAEIGTTRKSLYVWRASYLRGGALALRGRGEPWTAEVEAEPPPRASAAAPPLPRPSEQPVLAELAKARGRIRELERKIGQQQLDLDFFQHALRIIRERRQPSDGSGAKSSTPPSRR
jgi:transposase-like protein